jgi:hypothetical protein
MCFFGTPKAVGVLLETVKELHIRSCCTYIHSLTNSNFFVKNFYLKGGKTYCSRNSLRLKNWEVHENVEKVPTLNPSLCQLNLFLHFQFSKHLF